ncbi:MAG: DUF4838 domain-containing protein, partial [Cyclobacteriaceae bacterium]|nr:DUF4838 domain-containing protein [Cyclobacteriaceae bacterium]
MKHFITPLQWPNTILIAIILFALSAPLEAQRKSKEINREAAGQLIITNGDSTTRYRIVIPAAASEYEKEAGRVLQNHLLQISGTAIPQVTDEAPEYAYEIVLGQNARLDGENINFNDLEADGFLIRTRGKKLIIAGGNYKGTLYGVYTFLENYLGCRLYTPQVKVVPEQSRIIIGSINDQQVPAISYRTTHYKSAWDKEYVAWHKLDHDENGERPDWGMWVHTFHALVPPDVHFIEHPEYFSLVNGKRIPTQLCLTNPEVLEIVVQNLRKEIAQNPDAVYWSVSQNDNRNYCTCDNCTAIDDREGTPAGSIVQFVNQVADRFPDKIISTLAYEYGRKAPKTLKPRDNVNIMLCSIEVYRHLAIADDPESEDFVRDVEEWGKIANDIIVWDYVIQFPNLISPFPNLHVIKPNLQFFMENGVTAMFEQGNREVGGEFAELRAYLISKLMWDPNADVALLMDDFLNGYYGKAGPFIKTYIDDMTEALLKSGAPLRIFGSPKEATSSYLTPELITHYEDLFDQAEAAVGDSSEVLERVRIARL